VRSLFVRARYREAKVRGEFVYRPPEGEDQDGRTGGGGVHATAHGARAYVTSGVDFPAEDARS
jgi:hypothetical protein